MVFGRDIMFKYCILAIVLLMSQALYSQESSSSRAEYNAALAAGKPVVVVVSASWCGPCQKMKKNVWENDQFKKSLRKDVKFFKFDLDKNEDLKDIIGFEKIPTYAIVNGLQVSSKDQEMKALGEARELHLKNRLKELDVFFEKEIEKKKQEGVTSINGKPVAESFKDAKEQQIIESKKQLSSWYESQKAIIENKKFDGQYQVFSFEDLDTVLGRIGIGFPAENAESAKIDRKSVDSSGRVSEGYAESLTKEGTEKTTPAGKVIKH